MLDVPHLLGLLQEDPDNAQAVESLKSAVSNGERSDKAPRLVKAAREAHERRGEYWVATQLLEVETAFATGDPDGEASLWKELGRLHREELLDDEAAKAAYQRAAALRPGDDDIAEAIEALDAAADRWKEIAKRFVDEAEDASDGSLKTSLLVSAASLVWKYKKRGRDKDVDRLFGQALAADPGDGRAVRLYERILRSRESWQELSAMLLEAAEKSKNRDERVAFYLRAGRVLARHMDAADRAAACFERVLDFAPGHSEGMTYLVEYFTEKEQWDHLVALYDDALRGRQQLDSEQGILLQIGMVHWRFRGSPTEAEPYFARLRKMDPGHPGMLGFYRDHLSASGDHAKLLTILGDAARTVTKPKDKLELSIELAKAAASSGATDRAIDAWKGVQRLDPKNSDALGALRELYRTGEKWNALVDVLKGELDALPEDDKAGRVSLLREMVSIYRDHLQLDVMVINTWNAILTLAPDDEHALDALSSTYESTGRWNDLIQVLTKQAEAAQDPSTRVPLLMRVANLWIERFANYNQAAKPLEEVIEIDATRRDALALLKEIYTKRRAWKQLFDVQRAEAELASDPDARHAMRIELAKVAGEKLHRHADAIALWKEVVAHDSSNDEAVDALEKLAEREKDWPTLADVLDRRVEAQTDDKERVRLLTRLGTLAGEQIGDPARAAGAWKRVLDIDPKNGRAMRTLRESFVAAGDWKGLEALYGEANDWDGLAEVLGHAAERTEDSKLRVELSFRAAEVYEQKIGEPQRAFRSYERVLSTDAKNERAVRALLPLYEREEKWNRLPPLHEVLLAAAPRDDIDGRLEILGVIGSLFQDKLADDAGAFDAAFRAYQLAPTRDRVRKRLEESAAKAGAWDRLANAYLTRLPDAEADEKLRLQRRIAAIAGEQLGDVERAVAQLRDIVRDDPTDIEATESLERIYRKSARWIDLRALFESRLSRATDPVDRWALLRELARVCDMELHDGAAALTHYKAALEIDESDGEVLEALDRLALTDERWEDLAGVLRKRRELASDPEDRAELSLRLAEVLTSRAPDPSAAATVLAEVLEAKPGDQRAISALEALSAGDGPGAERAARLLEPAYKAGERWSELRAALDKRLAGMESAEEKREVRLRLADIAGQRLGDSEAAYGYLESAFLDDPAASELWDRLFAAADAAGTHESLSISIASALDATQMPPADAAVLAAKVANLYDDILAQPTEAEPFHRRVIQHDPIDERSFLALKELYTNREGWEDLQVLYRNRIAQTVDAEAKLDLLLQVCFLFEELIDDAALAIRAYQDVLELEPGHQASRHALERLYTREQRWRDLAALLEQQLSEVGGQEAVDLAYRLGDIHENKLSEPAQAVDRYESVLRDDESHQPAREAMERLIADRGQRQRVAAILEPVYASRGSWKELASTLDVQLEEIQDPGSRVALLTRIAEIHESQLADTAQAFAAWSRAVLADPADSHARAELARVATMQGADGERAAVLEKAVNATADSPGLQAELLAEVASIWDDRVGDPQKAEEAWTRLLRVAEDDPETVLRASRALEQIHLGRGDHRALADDLRRQGKLEHDPDLRGDILVRLAELLESTLDDVEGAIAVQRERVEIDPTNASAMTALARLYERTSQWQNLIGVLSSLDTTSVDEDEQKRLARRIGAIYETKLDDRESAIVAYNDVNGRFGSDAESLGALTRLYEAAERWDDLLEVVQMVEEIADGPEAKAVLRFHGAELMRTRVGEVERSIESYESVLEILPDHEGALRALRAIVDEGEDDTRLMAARALRPRYESRGDDAGLIAVLEVIARSEDMVERFGALRRAAEVADSRLQDPSRAYDFMARALRAGTSEPDLAFLVSESERHAAASDRFAELAGLLADVAPEIADADLQIEIYLRVAELCRGRLEDPTRARTYYEKILEARPDHVGALDALEQMTSQSGDDAGLLDVLARKAEGALGQERVSLLMRQAELHEMKLETPERAIDALEEALATDPAHAPAYQSLERLYEKAERWADLASLYERMLDGQVGFAVQNHFRLGKLCQDKLSDSWRALDHYRAGLALGAPHEPTIEALEGLLGEPELAPAAAEILEPIYLTRLQWSKVVAALEARLAAESGMEERKALLVRLGQVYEDYLEDLDGALIVNGRLLDEDPRDEGTWDTLGRLGRVLEKWESVADIYRTAVERTGVEDASTARLATHAAEIYAQKVRNDERAAALYRLVLRYSPDDHSAFGALEGLLTKAEKWDALLELYAEQAELASSDERRVGLHAQRARVLSERKNDKDGAIEVWREVLIIDPRQPEALERLDDLLHERERWQDLADHLRHRIDLVIGEPTEFDFKQRLAVLLAERLEDKGGAIDLLEEITAMDPHRSDAVMALEGMVTDADHQMRIIQILEPIYQATDQWKKRIAIQEARVGLIEDPIERVQVLSEIARLHEERGADAVRAFDAMRRAFIADPLDESVRGEVDRLGASLGAWDELVLAYEEAIGECDDPVTKSALLSAVARLHDEKRGDPRSSIETYERLLAHDPNDPSPLDALEALHTMVGDWAGMVDVLKRKVELTYDPVERGELLRRGGSVLEELLGNRNGAIELYRRAVDEDQTDAVSLESLDRLYTDSRDHAALGEVLSRRLELEQDPELRADLGLRLGRVAEEYLRQPDRAIMAFQRVLEDRPGEATAAAALARLYEREAQWPELLENLRMQAGIAQEPAARVAFLYRAAELLERQLDDVGDALITYEQVLDIDPRHEATVGALLRICRLEDYREQAAGIAIPLLSEQGRWDDLAQLLELTADASADPLGKRDELRRLAEVHEQGRGDKAAAFDAYCRALGEDRSDVELADQIERLGAELGNWAQVADAFAARAGSALDPEAARALYQRLARVAEAQLSDDARAIDAHQRILDQVGDDADSLAALDRLHLKGQHWAELAEVLERRAHGANDPTERADLLVRLGTLRWEHQEDTRGAFTAFRDVLERDPTEARALGACEGLMADEEMAPVVVDVLDAAYRSTGSMQKVAQLYDFRIRLAEDDGERVRLLVDQANILETDLGDATGALSATVRAFSLDPLDNTLLDEAERLAGAAETWEALRGVVERAASSEDLDRIHKRDLLLRGARWYRDRMDDLASAETCLTAALEADPEANDGHTQLVEILRAPGREADLTRALIAWAQVEYDEYAKKDRLREAARLAESALNDRVLAAQSLEGILAVDPGDAAALDELIRLRADEGAWAMVAELLERRIEVEADPSRRVAYRTQLATVLGERLNESTRAIDAWVAVLDETPTDLSVIARLEGLYEVAERWGDLEEIIQRRLDIAETAADRIAARVRLARLAEQRFGRRAEAIDQLHEILGEDPRNEEALDELERLYAADGRGADLIELLERRIGQAGGDPVAQGAGLGRLAKVYADQGDASAALNTYERSLALSPDDLEVLDSVASLRIAEGKKAEAADAIERRMQLLTGAEAVFEAYRLADIATELGDVARTGRALRHAYDLNPSSPDARARLAVHYESAQSWPELAQLLALQTDEIIEPAAKVAHLRRLADLHADKLGDAAGAASALEQAVQLAPDDRDVLLPLCDFYIAAGRQADAIPVLQKIVESYGTRRSKEVAVYHHRLGRAKEGMGDVEGALASFDAAFKVDLTNVAILRDLGRLCYQQGDMDRAQKTFRALLLQKLDDNSGISKADVYFYLGDIAARTGDPKKGISMLDRALAEDPSHAQAAALVAQLKG